MNKRRAVLENLAHAQRGNMGNPEDYIEMLSIDQALTALDKLEKEKMLEIVGEDEKFMTNDRKAGKTYNQAKAEIRKKINQPQDKERA